VYSIEEVCAEFGISRHTVYNWVKKGVLPHPEGGRRYAYYTDQHMKIIRAIKTLVHDRRVTLADLAERLHGAKEPVHA
jgi:excisionase family DNA binding protein